MIERRRAATMVLVLILAVTAVLLLLAGMGLPVQLVQADSGVLCVIPGGVGCNPAICGGTCYASVQDAVDNAIPNDEILVATGVYTGVHARNGFTQLLYISQTVDILGGYSSDFTVRDPQAYPTTLDAEGQGRVVYMGSSGSPTLDGFIITGGDATGLTTNCQNAGGPSDGCGGGIFVYLSSPLIANNIISDNVAAVSTGSHSASGGGINVLYGNGTVISSNLIINNYASTGERGRGGGICLTYAYNALVVSNRVISNAATTHASLYGWGGGIAVDGSGAVGIVQDNWVEGNRTNAGMATGQGAGIFNYVASFDYVGNQVIGNYGPEAVFLGGYGGLLFEANQVLSNSTSIGVRVQSSVPDPSMLVNNVVARSGEKAIAATTTAGNPMTVTMVHNTLVGSGTGPGLSVDSAYVTILLTNTIIASHTWGITNTFPASSTVIADHTLFWANDDDVIQGANALFGDPVFVSPDDGNYHLSPGSAAIDAAVETGENLDVDGDSRPAGLLPDIGADEAPPKVYLPLVLCSY